MWVGMKMLDKIRCVDRFTTSSRHDLDSSALSKSARTRDVVDFAIIAKEQPHFLF